VVACGAAEIGILAELMVVAWAGCAGCVGAPEFQKIRNSNSTCQNFNQKFIQPLAKSNNQW
jgi:hypothetical protein